MFQLFRVEDALSGGTAGELIREIQRGLKLTHLKKAKDRIIELQKYLIKNNNLSRLDRKSAERVLQDLKRAVKEAEGG